MTEIELEHFERGRDKRVSLLTQEIRRTWGEIAEKDTRIDFLERLVDDRTQDIVELNSDLSQAEGRLNGMKELMIQRGLNELKDEYCGSCGVAKGFEHKDWCGDDLQPHTGRDANG